jgi:hypothetical protein
MKPALKMFVPLLVGVLVLTAAVKTDHDHNADFSKYKTYSWLKAEASDTIWADRIRTDIDGQLQAKGWSRVESGGDAAVSAFGRVRNEQTLTTFYDGLGGGWFWRGFGPSTATTTVENTPVGTLVVHIFDASTKHLIWTGTSTETLSAKPEKNEKKLENAVEEMFNHFPPKSRG